MNERIRNFFDKFEQALNTSNIEQITDCYSDSFMFCNNNGVQAVKKVDFVKVVPKMRAAIKSAGLLSSKIKWVEEVSLNKNYYLVTVYWKMIIDRSQPGMKEIEISATYILFDQNSLLQIVYQLDHQDLMTRIEDAK